MGIVEEFSEVFGRTGYTLSIAESCTGGLIGHLITSAPGSSKYFLCGFIVYSNESKTEILGVPPEIIMRNGAVSRETVAWMLEGVVAKTRSDAAIAVSGIAGPTGGTEEKPVGTVFVGVTLKGKKRIEGYLFKGSRDEIKSMTAETALRNLIALVRENVEA